MKSSKYLSKLSKIPNSGEKVDIGEFMSKCAQFKSENVYLDSMLGATMGTAMLIDGGFFGLTKKINVDDRLVEAFETRYPNVGKSLFEKLQEKINDSEGNEWIVNGVKGKLFEMELVPKLEQTYPGTKFQLAASETQKDWDLIGRDATDGEILVQAKMGNSDYAEDVLEAMHENPEILYATSNEIRNKILESKPELIDQFVPDLNYNNAEFTSDVEGGLEQLLSNYGVDIPDDISDVLPFIGVFLLGIKLLHDLSKVKQDFSEVKIDDKRRIQGLKAIKLLSRFGVSAVVTAAGGAIGTAIPVPVGGTLIGLGAGLVASIYINKKIKPDLHKFALHLLEMTNEDLIYFRNKVNIDKLADKFRKRRIELEALKLEA